MISTPTMPRSWWPPAPGSPRSPGVAEAVDAVITCLPSPKVSERVLTGERGILKGLKPGATWIEMSTLDEQEVLRLGKVAAEAGVRMLESPVTGGVHLAASGEITVIIGGDSDFYDLHLPAFQAMGKQIFRAGPLGKAAVIKVITNMLAFIHLIATGEALMLAKRAASTSPTPSTSSRLPRATASCTRPRVR